ncbi:hypothetical protein ACP70R_030920 [Stipagrostis hirtigluma subsp. patula]
MARVIDSDYVDALSLIGGFDMGINLDGFEEHVKKFMELPIKYAHDKAVELFEDVHAMLYAPFPDDGVPNKLNKTSRDLCSSNVITGSSPTSVETEIVWPSVEVSTPLVSLITVENSSTPPFDMDAHETESSVTKDPENTSSKGGPIEVHDPCLLQGDTSVSEIYDSCTSEEVILWNPDISVKKVQAEPTTVFQDYVSHALDTDKAAEEAGLKSSGHSEPSVCNGATPLENSGVNDEEQMVVYSGNDPVEEIKHDVLRGADDANVWCDDKIRFVGINPGDDQEQQEQMGSHNIELSSASLPKNTSFKKMFMRSLSGKLGWSKKQTNAHQAVCARSQEAANLGYQLVSSGDDLEDDWQVV